MKGFRAGLRAGLKADRPKRKKPRQLTAVELAKVREAIARRRSGGVF